MKRFSPQIAQGDHLFQSDAWINAWAEAWHSTNAVINLSGRFDEFYRNTRNIKGLLTVDNVTPLGQNSDLIPSLRSEYFQLNSEKHLQNLTSEIRHQASLGDVLDESPTMKALQRECQAHGWYLTTRNPCSAYSVDTKPSFEAYCAGLSGSARAQIFNRRKRLNALGEVSFRDYGNERDAFLTLLNGFHEKRWGKPCFSSENLRFIQCLLKDEGVRPILSVMSLDGQPISVLLDVVVGRRRYNLQAGFQENLANGLALGILHLGYAIEESTKSDSIDVYDFMAGTGKQTNYKERFATHEIRLKDVIIVKPIWLQWVYKLHDRRTYGKDAN